MVRLTNNPFTKNVAAVGWLFIEMTQSILCLQNRQTQNTCFPTKYLHHKAEQYFRTVCRVAYQLHFLVTASQKNAVFQCKTRLEAGERQYMM